MELLLSEYQVTMLIMVSAAVFMIFTIVALVILLMWKIRGARMQEGFEEESYLVPVPGYNGDK